MRNEKLAMMNDWITRIDALLADVAAYNRAHDDGENPPEFDEVENDLIMARHDLNQLIP